MCTFESGFCDLVNDKVMDDFDWVLGQYTRTPTTGPRFDHTFGNGMIINLLLNLNDYAK